MAVNSCGISEILIMRTIFFFSQSGVGTTLRATFISFYGHLETVLCCTYASFEGAPAHRCWRISCN